MGQKCTEQVILSLKDLYLNESDPSLNQETHFHLPRLVAENNSSISESPDWIEEKQSEQTNLCRFDWWQKNGVENNPSLQLMLLTFELLDGDRRAHSQQPCSTPQSWFTLTDCWNWCWISPQTAGLWKRYSPATIWKMQFSVKAFQFTTSPLQVRWKVVDPNVIPMFLHLQSSNLLFHGPWKWSKENIKILSTALSKIQ